MRAAKLAAAAGALKRQSNVSGLIAEAPFSLAFLTDAKRARHPLLIARVLPKGAAIILRDYARPDRAAFAAQLKSVCAQRGVKLIIGADVELADRIGADGVHMPKWFTPSGPIPQNFIVTASCHDARGLARASAIGAHLALLSPVFSTASHPGKAGLGVERFRAIAAAASLPVLALGGVDEINAVQLAGPNVAGIAAIGAFL